MRIYLLLQRRSNVNPGTGFGLHHGLINLFIMNNKNPITNITPKAIPAISSSDILDILLDIF